MQEHMRLSAKLYYDSVNFTNFDKELDRSAIIKKAFKKYYKSNYINIRLVLNHIIILYNFFPNFGTEILMHVIPEDNYPILNTFLIFLNRLPTNKKDVKIEDKILGDLNNL
jgi:hypothetical protein